MRTVLLNIRESDLVLLDKSDQRGSLSRTNGELSSFRHETNGTFDYDMSQHSLELATCYVTVQSAFSRADQGLTANLPVECEHGL